MLISIIVNFSAAQGLVPRTRIDHSVKFLYAEHKFGFQIIAQRQDFGSFTSIVGIYFILGVKILKQLYCTKICIVIAPHLYSI